MRLTSILAFLLLLAAWPAEAQETGSSFGGSDWGDTSSGSSDWGSSSGSSDYGSTDYGSSSSDYGSSYGSSDYGSGYGSSSSGYRSSSGSTAGDPLAGLIVLAMVIFFVCVVVFFVQTSGWRPFAEEPTFASAHAGRHAYPHAPPRPHGDAIDVSMLQLAVDHRARRFLQAELAKLAGAGDTATKEGRARLLKETTRALRSIELAWLYAGARNFRPAPAALARKNFQGLANDVRATFGQEILRAADGRTVRVEAVGVRAKEHEGPGVVLVSVLVAARREIFDFRAERAGDIRTLLDQLGGLSANELVALEVVWTPASEEDRMSTAELEARHPHLILIGDIGGRVFCVFCGGPHAAELEKCPHCGAPVERAEA